MKKLLSLLLTLAMTLSVFSGITVTAADPVVVYEDNFDSYLFDAPDDWIIPENAFLQSQIAKAGKAMKIKDDSDTAPVHIKSPYIPITPGKTYTTTVDMLLISGDAIYVYLKFFDADNKEIKSSSTSTTEQEWREVSVVAGAPAEAVTCRVFLVTNKVTIAEGAFDNVKVFDGTIWPKHSTKMIPPTQADPVDGKLIQPVGDKLQYNTYSDNGDRLGDFSKAGFYKGEYELPDSSKLPLAATIEPSKNPDADDTARIQEVIDSVYNNAANDYFKVIKIKAGRYNINADGINLRSGIILSGEGQGPEGTVLFATDKKQYSVIKISGEAPSAVGGIHYITDEYVPAGSYEISLSAADIKNYSVGDLITLYHRGTEEWNKAMDMVGVINVYDNDTSWIDGTTDMKEERYITAINGNTITLDIPVYVPYEKKYSPAYIYKTEDNGRLENVGVENLRVESYFNGDPTDEAHASNAIWIGAAKNCYVRDVSGKYLVLSLVVCNDGAKQITVKNCSCIEPVSQIAGSRRYAFYANQGSQQIYFTGCYSYSGRHDFMASRPSTGPVVFTDNVVDYSNSQSETHGTWSTGTLYDNLFITGSESNGWIGFTNRGIYGTVRSQGWTSAGTVAWNCLSPIILGNKPPLNYQNFIIGEWGHYTSSAAAARKASAITATKKIYRTGTSLEYTEANFATSDNTSFVGDVYKESETAPVEPRSLFKAQLAERLTGSFKNTKPNAPIIAAPRGEEEHKLLSNDVVINGIYQKGAEKVTIYIDNQAYDATLNNKDYSFELKVNLADGVHKIYATQTIDGVEGTKCADRFVVVKKLNGNEDYLQSQYEYDKIHQLTNDSIVSFDVYQNENAKAVADKITVKVNGRNLRTDVDPIEISGRVLVPMRAIFESFEAEVNWDEATATATATKEGRVVQVTENSTVTKVDGQDVVIDVPATIIDGRFLVPVRFISESFGAKVDWLDLRRTVVITGGTVVYLPTHQLENELGLYGAIQSGDDGAGAVITNAFDNNTGTSWGVSINNKNGAYGIFDLGMPKNIKDFHIAFNKGDKRVYTFDLLVSDDDVNYTLVLDHAQSSGTSLALEAFPMNVRARYVKLVGYGNNTNEWNNFTEIAITEAK